MYSVMRVLTAPNRQRIAEFLSLDSRNRIYWTRFGPHITAFNDEDLAKQWVERINAYYGCEVASVCFGPDACDA